MKPMRWRLAATALLFPNACFAQIVACPGWRTGMSAERIEVKAGAACEVTVDLDRTSRRAVGGYSWRIDDVKIVARPKRGFAGVNGKQLVYRAGQSGADKFVIEVHVTRVDNATETIRTDVFVDVK